MVALRAQLTNQALLPRSTRGLGVKLEAKAGGVESPYADLGVAQMSEQCLLEVIPRSDVNPLAPIEYSVNARSRGSVRPHRHRGKSERVFLGKWHGDPLEFSASPARAGVVAALLVSEGAPIRQSSGHGEQCGCTTD